MDQNRGVGEPDYVFVQTVVVRAARQAHWLERTLGKGRLLEVCGLSRTTPRLGPVQSGRSLRKGPARTPGSVDFWVNAIAVATLVAFLLSLYLLR